MEPILVGLTAVPEEIRTETFEDEEHIVVPVVALVEGVFQCATCPEAELYLASEFADVTAAWNGRPVTLGHPQRNGLFVSAGRPDVFENERFGTIFNATLEDSKLKVEAWINMNTVENGSDELKDTVKRIQEGEEVEISTGYFADVEPRSGVFNGRTFTGIQKNIKPDHLAILKEGMIGACSWEDGCGAPRLNVNATKQNCEACDVQEKSIRDATAELLGVNLSDKDKRFAIESALIKKNDNPFFFLVSVDSDDGTFVFEEMGMLKQSTFEIAEDGTVVLGDNIEEVRPVTSFVTVKTNEVNPMEEKVKALIENERTNFTEEHREWLLSLNEEQLETLEPVAEETQEDDQEETETQETETTPNESKKLKMKSIEDETPQTAEDVISNIGNDEISAVLASGLRMHRQRKAELVKELTSNDRCKFTKEQLSGMELEHLENLVELAGSDDYSGRGAPRTNVTEDDNAVPAPPLVFPVKEAS